MYYCNNKTDQLTTLEYIRAKLWGEEKQGQGSLLKTMTHKK